jgi:HAD superfamily hydrolase (TIGR01484 family)
LRPDGTVSDRTRRTIRAVEECGVRVVLVTARPPRIASRFALEAGVAHGLLICCNGALVYDVERHAIARHSPLEPIAAAALVSAIRRAVPGACFAVELGVDFGHDHAYAALVALARPAEPFDVGTPSLFADSADLCRLPVTKLIVRHADHAADVLLPVVRGIVGPAAAVTHSGGPFVEVSAAGVHKAAALEALSTDLGVDRSEVLAFGDMPNDAPMLAWAGRGVAVANAHPDAIAAADELTASNAEDGVAAALERLVLGVGD